MSQHKSFPGVFTESGPLIALAVAIALLVGIVGPASAQFFNFGGPPRPPASVPRSGGFGGGWFGGDLFAPFQQQAPKRVENFSRAPPPEKRDPSIVPERNMLVLGDAMADWLAYGLEDAYFEQPDMGVIRKHKTVSGLIKYQPKGEPSDWAAAAKGILATEKPDAIIVMLGLNDRAAIREPVAEKSDKKTSDKKTDDRTPNRAKPNPAPSRTTLPTALRSPRPNRPTRKQPPTMPTMMPRRPSRRRKAPVPRPASMNFAMIAGSNSTPRRSKR